MRSVTVVPFPIFLPTRVPLTNLTAVSICSVLSTIGATPTHIILISYFVLSSLSNPSDVFPCGPARNVTSILSRFTIVVDSCYDESCSSHAKTFILHVRTAHPVLHEKYTCCCYNCRLNNMKRSLRAQTVFYRRLRPYRTCQYHRVQ